jgi:hypothetical protein
LLELRILAGLRFLLEQRDGVFTLERRIATSRSRTGRGR